MHTKSNRLTEISADSEPVIELQLEKAGVRLAYVLDTALK